MKTTAKQNALLVAILAAFFCWSFEFFKHDPTLMNMIPFGEDPYDSVSSFASVAVVLLALVSYLRSYFPRGLTRNDQSIYTRRTQAAVPFCILVTVAAEGVAMARHSAQWIGVAGSARLILLEALLVAASGAVLVATRSERSNSLTEFIRAAVIWLATLLILAAYPEQMILQTPGHLLTVVFGAVLLFGPVSALVKVWLPRPLNNPPPTTSKRAPRAVIPKYAAFAAAAFIGLLVGAFAYVGEVSEDAVRPPIAQMLFVGGVFVGLGAGGMMIGYAFLGRLLGLGLREPPAQQST